MSSHRSPLPPPRRRAPLFTVGFPTGLTGVMVLLASGILDGPPRALVPSPTAVEEVAFVPIRVGSDFAGALNGWGFSGGQAGSAVEHRMEAGADGSPGFLRFRDGGGGAAAYLSMASVHRGDQSALFGGTISFSLRLVSGGEWIGDRQPLLRITGANGAVMAYHHGFAPAREGWTDHAIPVEPGAWRIDGQPASAEAMRAILAAVAQSELRIEQLHGGGEVVDLDSVRFEGDYGSIRVRRRVPAPGG
jgi:hypothetical protein